MMVLTEGGNWPLPREVADLKKTCQFNSQKYLRPYSYTYVRTETQSGIETFGNWSWHVFFKSQQLPLAMASYHPQWAASMLRASLVWSATGSGKLSTAERRWKQLGHTNRCKWIGYKSSTKILLDFAELLWNLKRIQ